jgi:hypothetical protein
MFPMELFSTDLSTAERIVVGMLSLIALIVYLRWRGPPQDQKKKGPGSTDKRSNKY